MSKNRRGERFFSMPLNWSICRAECLSYVDNKKTCYHPFCVDNKLENIVISPKDVISLLISSTWRMITRNQLIILLDANNEFKSIFDGNRADVTTTEEMVLAMESKYGKANRIWVMDRGMVSEENIEFMKKRGARYIVGTPKSMLRKFEQELLTKGWEEVHPGVEVKICAGSEEGNETFVLCRSEGRKDKETAILNRFLDRLQAGLGKLKEQAEKGRLKDRQQAERRIGRLLERNSRAASLFTITVTETGSGKERRLAIDIKKSEDRYQWALQSGGSYILRTNWTEADPKTIWKKYIQLTEVEDAFRTEKHDLGMRPIYHQKKRQNTSPYPGLLSGALDVADTSAVDEGIRAWYITEKTY